MSVRRMNRGAAGTYKPVVVAALVAFAFTQSATAADLPVKAPIPKARVTLFDWTGFYLGAYAGVGVEGSRGVDPTGVTSGGLDYIGTGFGAGGTAGINWQFYPNWVMGVEGDVGHLGLSRGFLDFNPDPAFASKTSWIATVRGRLGHSNGPTLRYITGGAVWVNVGDVNDFSAVSGILTSASRTGVGFAVGTGVETMLGGNWSAKVEYLHVDAGKGDTLNSAGAGLCAVSCTVQVDHRYHLIRYGLNYRFGTAPQPPLPANNWSGFYAGVVGGSAVTATHASDTIAVPSIGEIRTNGTGLTAGAQLGYNWQVAPAWLVGVEGDFNWVGIDRSTLDWNWDPNFTFLGVKTNWLATLRGRIGYSTGPAFLYVTGGGAWMNVTNSFALSSPIAEITQTLSGWIFGGGIETVLVGNWTTRTEYLYFNAGDARDLVIDGGDAAMRPNQKFHLFRTGLTYRFGS